MEESVLVDRFRKWVIQRGTESFPVTENEEGNLEIESQYGLGRVNFYPDAIVELRIDTFRDETVFFLHFQLNTIEKAKDLYVEMEEAMRDLKAQDSKRIVLSCTSALTTSYYAELLNKAAETLSLKYTFCAYSIDKLLCNSKGADMILLAPQVHYMREKLEKQIKNVPIRNIPGHIFGKYDTGALIEMVKGELDELEEKMTPKYKRTQTFFETNKKILTIGYTNGARGKDAYIIYRYYRNGDIAWSGQMKSEGVSMEELCQTITPLLEKYPEIEVIGLSLPGTIENGVIYLQGSSIHLHNVQSELKEKYHRTVFAFNDANMIVTGIYWLEDRYRSLALYFLPTDAGSAGCGIVVNGHLIRGYQHVAGEVMYTQNVLRLSDDANTLMQSEEGTYEVVSKTLVTLVASLGPEAIFVYSPKSSDMKKMKAYMQKYVAEKFLPDLYNIEDVSEYMMTGTFLRCIWKIDDIKRMQYGLTHNPYK